MKTLIISAVFPPEPVVAARLSYDIASELSKTYDLSVVSPLPTRPLGFKFKNENIVQDFNHIIAKSYTCPKFSVLGRLRESYSFGKYCFDYIKKHNSSIGFIYSVTWPLIAQYFTVRAAKKYNIPIVVHVQDIYPESLTNILPIGGNLFKKLLLPIDKYVLRKASGIIAISEKMKVYLESTRSIRKGKISVVQNWQNELPFLDFHKKNTSEFKKPFTFMYLGNIGPLAGIEFVIDAFEYSNLKGCRLIIAGSGSMKDSLMKNVIERKLESIEFWDVPEGQVPEIQNCADVMILPIKKGGAANSIPSKLPAYMFSMKPIIASVDESSDTANSIEKAQCGWIVPSEDIKKLSNEMRNASKLSKDELLTIGKKGFTFAMREFSRQENLQKVILNFKKNWNGFNG